MAFFGINNLTVFAASFETIQNWSYCPYGTSIYNNSSCHVENSTYIYTTGNINNTNPVTKISTQRFTQLGYDGLEKHTEFYKWGGTSDCSTTGTISFYADLVLDDVNGNLPNNTLDPSQWSNVSIRSTRSITYNNYYNWLSNNGGTQYDNKVGVSVAKSDGSSENNCTFVAFGSVKKIRFLCSVPSGTTGYQLKVNNYNENGSKVSQLRNAGATFVTGVKVTTLSDPCATIPDSQQGVIDSITGQTSDIIEGIGGIIDNQNQNTQDILDGINDFKDQEQREDDETQQKLDEIDGKLGGIGDSIDRLTCNYLTFDSSMSPGYINSSGEVVQSPTWYHNDYTAFNFLSIEVYQNSLTNNAVNICFYRKDKSFIGCRSYSSSSGPNVSNLPVDSYYFRASFNNNPNSRITFKYCTNLTGSDVTTNSGMFNGINQMSDTPVSNLLLMPLNLAQKIYDNVSVTTCDPYNVNVTLPGNNNVPLTFSCPDYNDLIGQGPTTIIDALICFGLIYGIAMAGIKFYEDWSSLHDTFDNLYKGGGS